jgi:hypothetical protein
MYERPPTILDLRLAARARGEKTFTVNVPCKRGHIGPRYTSTGGCCECLGVGQAKALTANQLLTVQRYNPMPLLLAAEVTPDQIENLDRYLLHCAHHFCKSVIKMRDADNILRIARLAWVSEEPGRKLRDYKMPKGWAL